MTGQSDQRMTLISLSTLVQYFSFANIYLLDSRKPVSDLNCEHKGPPSNNGALKGRPISLLHGRLIQKEDVQRQTR